VALRVGTLRAMNVSTVALVGLLSISFATGCSPSRKELMAELDAVKGQLGEMQADNVRLRDQITNLEQEIAAQKQTIDDLVAKNQANEAELEELRAAKAEREKELQVYKSLFAKLKKLIDAGTIKVVFRKGKMMVEMSSAVLFDSGKSVLKEDGRNTLTEITQALMSVADRDFLVAGHTDNIPIKTARFPSNWELSAERAIVVVKHMIDQGFPQDHIGAAGYAHVDPVGSNDTPEGRAENRRIEIILVPNLGELKGIREMLEG
jgi:chemotaxis protein MotB